MLLFHSKIDLYSSFTLNLGPLYVERVFDSLLTRQGVNDVFQMNDIERFVHYLEYIRQKSNPNSRSQFTFIQFYKGHFYQQLANHSCPRNDVQHFLEKALCYYQTYLELSIHIDESIYYAQWQIGMLQDRLRYPWPQAEYSLLKASAFDPLRGEAIKKIIEHYVYNKQWNKAFHYSTMAMDQFMNKNPVARRRWFIDFDAYNWNIVKTHRTICFKLGYLTEKLTTDGPVDKEAIAQQGQF
jgi:hypothetical protein